MSEWSEKEGIKRFKRGPKPKNSGEIQDKPIVSLEEITKAERDIEQLHLNVMQRFQEMLNDLAGRRTGSETGDRKLVERIRQTAEKSGAHLYYKGQRVTIRWNAGVFVLHAAVKERPYVDSNPVFLPLEARSIFDPGTPGSHDLERGCPR